MDYNAYYLKQAGGGDYSIYRGQPFQKGSGLGGIFKRFFKWIVPIVRTHAVPALESGAKFVGREVVNSTSNLARDLMDGKNFKAAAEDRFNSAVDNIKNRAEDTLQGKGIKRKRSKQNFIILKKKNNNKSRTLDIFD